MHSKSLLLFVVLLLAALVPLNAVSIAPSSPSEIKQETQVEVAKQKVDKNKRTRRTPVLPAIALSLGIIAVVSFIVLGWPGLVIGALAVVVGSIVLTRRNVYSKKDRIMARIGLILGSLFLTLGLIVIVALLDQAVGDLEVLEPLLEHVLG